LSDRKRLLGINIRVTEQEKKRILRNAKRCGLTASEYLRQLGSGHTPQAVPTPDIVEVCGMIPELIEYYAANYGDSQFQQYMKYALDKLLAFCNPKEEKTGSPQSLLCGEKEHPRSGEPSPLATEATSGA